MNDRSRAIEILKRARDLLAERLTERVLEASDEILADAMGMSYQSEIDVLYEQLGSRLSHLTSMLASLPPQAEPPAEAEATPAGKQSKSGGLAVLPAPRPIAGYLPAKAPVSFRSFASAVQTGDLSSAGASLAALFELDRERGQRCAEIFFTRLREEPAVIVKAQQLRYELEGRNYNASLLLLWECFGLQGLESLGVMEALQRHLGGNMK